MVLFIAGVVVGTVVGLLIGRRNKNKVDAAVAKAEQWKKGQSV
jgi:uncharacterized membrane-anchored protein YhcB (DUF1043 family)